jgi:hypothetical protein
LTFWKVVQVFLDGPCNRNLGWCFGGSISCGSDSDTRSIMSVSAGGADRDCSGLVLYMIEVVDSNNCLVNY